MAIITEPEEPKITKSPPTPTPTPTPTPNPFIFWFYFTLTISLLTFIFVSLSSSLSPHDPKSWFLSLPNDLRHHYSNGRTIKVQPNPNHHTPIELFAIESGSGPENVVFVHGLGISSFAFREKVRSLSSRGVRAVAIDLPGSGFSDKSRIEVGVSENGGFLRVFDVYGMIREKGVFWAIDEIIGTGVMPYEEIKNWASNRKSVRVLQLGPEEIGRVLGQVIDSMRLSPVNLVLHDSALTMCANWVLENSESVRSVTLLDTSSRSVPALPIWVLEIPLIREVVLGFSTVYVKFVNMFCSNFFEKTDVEAHRVLLKGRDGRKAIVAMSKMLNHSFDLAEWGGSDGLKGVPMQVVWSNSWSEEWSKEGLHVANALPQAKFVAHSGGRWPQDDTADELTETIVEFISSLPKLVKQVEEEPIPENIQELLDKAKSKDHHHHGHVDHQHHDDHAHSHGADFMDAYGLGQGFAT